MSDALSPSPMLSKAPARSLRWRRLLEHRRAAAPLKYLSPVKPWLRISSSLLVLAGFLALASVRGYGASFALVPLVLVPLAPWAERLHVRYAWYSRITWTLTLGYFLVIPYTLAIFGRIDSVVALVVFILVYLLLHRKTERHYLYLFLMSFMLLLAACVQAPEPQIGLVLALFLFSAIWSLIALRRQVEMHDTVLPDFLPAAGQPPSGLADPEEQHTWRLAFSAAILAALGLALTIGIFLITPRMEAGIFGRDVTPEHSRTGISEQVDVSGGGLVEQDMTAVMHVEFPDLEQGIYPGIMYWRITTLSQYAGAQWSRRGISTHYELPLEPGMRRGRASGAYRDSNPAHIQRFRIPNRNRVRQVIYMDAVPEEGVPCLDLVQSVVLLSSPRGFTLRWDDLQDSTVVLDTTGSRRISYEAISETGEAGPDILRNARPDYQNVLSARDFALLTSNDLSDEAKEVVQRVTANARNPYDIATALRDWLSGPDFSYTLDVPPLPRFGAMDTFILNVRRGHCELFASALAMMLRSQGIPARAVSGFRGGEYDPDTQSYTVRAADAHLWVEVLFPDHGWVVFDPSPQVSPDDLGQIASLSRTFSRFTLETKMFWYQKVIGFDRGLQLEYVRDSLGQISGLLPALRTFGEMAPGGPGLGFPIAVLAVLAAALVLAYTAHRLRAPAARRVNLTQDQVRAGRLYRMLMLRTGHRAADLHVRTAEEWLAELSCSQPEYAGLGEEILHLYNEVRFGGRPFPHEDFAALRRRLRRFPRLEDSALKHE